MLGKIQLSKREKSAKDSPLLCKMPSKEHWQLMSSGHGADAVCPSLLMASVLGSKGHKMLHKRPHGSPGLSAMLMSPPEMLWLLFSFHPHLSAWRSPAHCWLTMILFPWLSVREAQPSDVFLSIAELSPKFKCFGQLYIKHFDWIKSTHIFIMGSFGWISHIEISSSNIWTL